MEKLERKHRSVTEALIARLEDADNLESVVIVFRRPCDDKDAMFPCGYAVGTAKDNPLSAGDINLMLDEAKDILLHPTDDCKYLPVKNRAEL